MHPIALNLGGYPIYWYGVLMAVAFFVGLRNASRRGRRAGVAPETITDAGLWLIAGAVVGARTLFVATHWQEFFAGEFSRRSIIALRDIAAGERLTIENTGLRRPGSGLPPALFERVLGATAARRIEKGRLLQWSDLA